MSPVPGTDGSASADQSLIGGISINRMSSRGGSYDERLEFVSSLIDRAFQQGRRVAGEVGIAIGMVDSYPDHDVIFDYIEGQLLPEPRAEEANADALSPELPQVAERSGAPMVFSTYADVLEGYRELYGHQGLANLLPSDQQRFSDGLQDVFIGGASSDPNERAQRLEGARQALAETRKHLGLKPPSTPKPVEAPPTDATPANDTEPPQSQSLLELAKQRPWEAVAIFVGACILTRAGFRATAAPQTSGTPLPAPTGGLPFSLRQTPQTY